MNIDWTLYLITDPELAGGRDKVIPIVQEAVRGGATVVQLRDKEASDEEVEATARELMKVLGDVPLFINDRVEVAAKVGCHLHIGQDDMDFSQARALLGPDKLIGLSVGTREELDAIDPQEAPMSLASAQFTRRRPRRMHPRESAPRPLGTLPPRRANAASSPSPSAASRHTMPTNFPEAASQGSAWSATSWLPMTRQRQHTT